MITAAQLKHKKIAAIVAAVILLLAIPSIWPYAYYQILRWVVTAAALYIAYVAYRLGRKSWVGVMIAMAVLFNPLLPIHLDKEMWSIIDFVAAVAFLTSLRFKGEA